MSAARLPPLALGVVGLLAACVPAEPEREIRGGVSVTFLPSEATAGVPFQTNDGWTVTIEKTALRAQASAIKADYGQEGRPRVFDPRYACELRASKLFPGKYSIILTLQTFDPDGSDQIEGDDVCAVDAATLRRFTTPAEDVGIRSDADPRAPKASTPSFLVKGTAAKDGRAVSFDWALGIDLPLFPSWGSGEGANVMPLEGAPAPLEVHFESLFADGVDPIASADSDHDGVITTVELDAIPLDECASVLLPQCHTRLDRIIDQAAQAIGKARDY